MKRMYPAVLTEVMNGDFCVEPIGGKFRFSSYDSHIADFCHWNIERPFGDADRAIALRQPRG